MKKLYVSHLIALLLLILLVSNALAAPGTAGRQLSSGPFRADESGKSFGAVDCLNNCAFNLPGVNFSWPYYQYLGLTYCDAADLTTEQQYWSYYQNPPATTAFTDLSAAQRYWSYYQNSPGTTAFADLSGGQRYWSYYQNPPASTIMSEIASK